MARHQVTRDQDRRSCLGCVLFIFLVSAVGVAAALLAALLPSGR